MTVLFAMTFISFTSAQEQTTTTEMQFDDIEPYAGNIPPGHFMYGFKLMFENVNEMLTLDRTRRIEKKLKHAQTRLAEAKLEMSQNRVQTVNKLMERYRTKMLGVELDIKKITYSDLAGLSVEKKIRIENVATQIQRHEQILNKLSENNPDNVGLQNAVQNAKQLQERTHMILVMKHATQFKNK